MAPRAGHTAELPLFAAAQPLSCSEEIWEVLTEARTNLHHESATGSVHKAGAAIIYFVTERSLPHVLERGKRDEVWERTLSPVHQASHCCADTGGSGGEGVFAGPKAGDEFVLALISGWKPHQNEHEQSMQPNDPALHRHLLPLLSGMLLQRFSEPEARISQSPKNHAM